MIFQREPDDAESAEKSPGPDLCTLLDEYWDKLDDEPTVDPQRRRPTIDRARCGESIAGDLDVLRLLHEARWPACASDETSAFGTAWLSGPSAVEAPSPPAGQLAGATHPPPDEAQVAVDHPRQIGKYLVVEMVDSGGQGQVFRVIHPGLAQEFALKLARRPIAMAERADRDALLEEGRRLAQCQHPNLVPVIDADVHEGRRFVVMEYVKGLTLPQFVARNRPGQREAARFVIELARAVAYLHERGIVHQDIKPQNVVLDERGRPRLIDLGMARQNHAWCDDAEDWVGGTVGYMSPEQALGRVDLIGPGTDVFGLGGLLYHLLTGRPLYVASSRASALRLAREADFIPVRRLNPRVPRSLERVCHKALAFDLQRRHGTALELELAIKRSLARRSIVAAGVIAPLFLAAGLIVPWPRPRAANPGQALVPPRAAPRAETPAPPFRLKIAALDVVHFRGRESVGLIGVSSQSTMEGDRVGPSARINAPAYSYLIALDPDGKDQLCIVPGDTNGDPPPQSSKIPVGRPVEFDLTDGPGWQAFVVVTSRTPLPHYLQWSGRDGLRRYWRDIAADDDVSGVWIFDGEFVPVYSVSRGPISAGAAPVVPEPFRAVCEYLAKLPDGAAIRAIAFPVKPKK